MGRGLRVVFRPWAAVLLLLGASSAILAAHRGPASVEKVASLPLIDQSGAPRALASWRGQAMVLDFIFTGCGDICPIKTAQLAGVQASLPAPVRQRVQFVSVSVDPEHDDPASLRAYAARAGADLRDWAFLTGSLVNVARLVADFDAGLESDGTHPSHLATVHLMDSEGRVVERFIGDTVDEPALERAIASLVDATPR